MRSIQNDLLASISFHLEWEKDSIRHTDILHAPRVNFWRDLLRPPFNETLRGCRSGDRPDVAFAPGTLTCARKAGQVYRVPWKQVVPIQRGGERFTPRYGRFYPAGVLRELPGVFLGSVLPFRCVDVHPDGILADFNHPLAEAPLKVTAVVEDVRDKFEERGGTCQDWLEALATGPGFQARIDGGPTDFLVPGALEREDEAADPIFYQRPRMVQHIDDAAIGAVSDLYGRLLPAGGRVLDLMSGWTSHLPPEKDVAEVVGLGLNAEELAANPRLASRVVHDLNADPRLPL